MQWQKESTFIKSNRLSDVFSEPLNLIEIRVLQMVMAEFWRSPTLPTDDSKGLIRIHQSQYIHHYNVCRVAGYKALQQSIGLQHKSFRFKDSPDITHKWVNSMSYMTNEGCLAIGLSEAVLAEIPCDKEVMPASNFTLFDLTEVARLNSVFSLRLFDILKPWCVAGVSPLYSIQELRLLLGLSADQYRRMTDFKRVCISAAVENINKELGWDVKVKQKKRGRNINTIQFFINGVSK